MNATTSIVAYLDKLIAEGETLLSKKFKVETSSFTSDNFVPLDSFRRWVGNCLVLKSMLGRGFEPWETIVRVDVPNKAVNLTSLLGTVRSIKDAVEGGHLVKITDLIVAEAFSNLLDQADYLLGKGYWLAAGVLGRAVLEEELRVIAQKLGCLPQKGRPTLNDLTIALYKANAFDKLDLKLIESLTAVGNECAHNQPGATEERVKHLLEQLIVLLPRLAANPSS